MSDKLIKLADTNNHIGDKTLHGFVKISDAETGEVLLKKKNIIVLRGRTFSLEKIFNDPIPENFNGKNYISNLNRQVCLFQVGEGGAPLDDPFNPFVPDMTDSGVQAPIPFRVVDVNKPETLLTEEEKKMYHNAVVDGDLTKYYSKSFSNTPEWMTSSDAKNILIDSGVKLDTDPNNPNAGLIEEIEAHEIYKYIVLKVNLLDCRTTDKEIINEISLQIAEYDEQTKTYKDIESFSRITFPTESLKSNEKKILVEYLVYA